MHVESLPERFDRSDPRFDFEGRIRLRVVLTPRDDPEPEVGWIRNLSRTGVHVETSRPLPEDALVDFAFTLPDGSEAEVLGLVKWSRAGRGAGVEFFYATDEERQRVQTALESLDA